MKKIFPLFSALLLFMIMVAGCSSDSSTNPGSSGYQIASLADDMRECAPDLASSVITDWASGTDGWSGHVEYGVLKKHFDSTSGSESIYATVLMLDQMTTQLAGMSSEIFEQDGSATQGDYTVTYSAYSGNLTLPSILGSTVVTDFERYLDISSTSGYTSELYYKASGSDNTEKIFYNFQNTSDNESGLVYAVRDSSTNDLTVYTACHKASGTIPAAGSSHADSDFRCLLYFIGNITAQNFKFKVKTDAANGWAFFGGGSVASDTDYIAVRGTDAADSQTYANDGSGFSTDGSDETSYVILTFGDMNDSTFDGGGYPALDSSLSGDANSAKSFITLGNADCLFANIAAFQAWKYPEEASELGF